ncbi:hypothetical protein BGX28_005639 [Mortierella sp. GBA30]|nr:hypothetical protein BGX28_005639 [Mortierella sp. GBA30]
MTSTSVFSQSIHKDIHGSSEASVYPSPSLSPATTFLASMQQEHSSPSALNRRRPSVKALLNSANPPASPLDALVMALEATVEEEENGGQDQPSESRSAQAAEPEEEEDPDATIPSSPTMFMKRPATGPSLHHLPTMLLPESAASTASAASASSASTSVLHSQSSGLTPSTLPSGSAMGHISQRKMSISSQGSVSSAISTAERTKEYACTIGNCEKKFYQVAHLRSHER